MTIEHGFCRGRRREDATLAVQLLSWRLRRAGHSFACTYRDMANAFARGSWEELTNAVNLHAAPEN
eukprot:8997424-Pyramimonas_sp.AAC.1